MVRPSVTADATRIAARRGHDHLYWEFHERGFSQAVRIGQWKGVRTDVNKPLELYDLTNDIGEQTNVAEKQPGVVAKIEGLMKTARTESPDWPVRATANKKQVVK